MKKLLSLFLLFCALFCASISRDNMAQAASITGKVGVGTWGNTQAEFTNFKVVQGTTTLYQSDFTSGMTDWTTLGGTWGTSNGNLQQSGSASPALALVGNTDWSNYTLTLKARKISGDEGFLIALGSPGDTTTTWWNIGGWGNTKHALQIDGVPTSDYAGSVQTGVWYDIKVELSGPDIRCYLNGTLIHDTARFLNASDRTDRFNELINSPGFGWLDGNEQDALRNLAGRDVYIGDAAKATFNAMPMSGLSFAALTPQQQAFIIRKVNMNRLTWQRGYGFDGSNGWRDWYITTNMDAAVVMFNSNGVFDKHETVNNDPGVPTADANYDGWMRFGSQMTVRTCIHEINHTLGGGTYWRWPNLMYNGVWHGQYGNMKLAEFDGPGSIIYGDTQHSWPYGLNQDSEYSDLNAYRSIIKQGAMRRDMLIADQMNYNYSTDVASGTYTLIPRHAPGKALAVLGDNPNNSAPLGLWTPNGGDGQKFQFDLEPEGTYRIRTALTGNRCVEMPGGNTDNGTQVKLWDDNGLAPQRWFLIPSDSGYYKIAPLNNNFKSMEAYYAGTGDGTVVDNWDYTDNFCQQWKIVPSAQVAPTTTVPDGTYTLTPRHAQDKVLDVYGAVGANADKIDIWTANGGDNQKFLLDKQSDGTYRIRTKLAGNRAVEMPGGTTDNGTDLQLYDDNSSAGQRWYLIPTDNGWFKIAPKNDITKSMDVTGVSTADGALADSWDYLSGNNQQWKLTPVKSTANNTAPVVSSVTIAPANPTTDSKLTTTVTASDADSDTLTYSYIWKKNDVVIDGETGATLDLSKAGNGDRGDKITVTVTANDGTVDSAAVTSDSVTIINKAPVISSVSITPATPTTNSMLTATVSATDADNDSLTYSYVWKKNGAVITGETGSTLDLSKTGNGDKTDVITVTATANDGNGGTNLLAATDVIIGNTAPVVTSVNLTPSNPGTNSTLTATASASDADSDTLTYSYVWKKNGTTIAGETGKTLDLSKAGNGDDNDSLTVTVKANDGTADSAPATSGAVIVGLSNKAPVVVSITPASATDTVGNSRTITVTVSDANGVGDIKNVWMLANTVMGWANGLTLVYDKVNNQLFLRDGDHFTNSITPGSGTLSNGAATIAGSSVTATTPNSTTLALTFTAQTKVGIRGVNKVWGRVEDMSGATDARATDNPSGFMLKGDWTVNAPVGPQR